MGGDATTALSWNGFRSLEPHRPAASESCEGGSARIDIALSFAPRLARELTPTLNSFGRWDDCLRPVLRHIDLIEGYHNCVTKCVFSVFWLFPWVDSRYIAHGKIRRMARILIVDDVEEVRALLADLLRSCDHEVELARNGVEALERFLAAPFDLLICDLLLPLKGGLETIKELRETNPLLKIIAISGTFDVTTQSKAGLCRDWATKMGADYTMSKPFDCDEIKSAVRRLLG